MVQAKGDIANHLKDDEDDNLLKAEKLKERERKEKAWYNLWWSFLVLEPMFGKVRIMDYTDINFLCILTRRYFHKKN